MFKAILAGVVVTVLAGPSVAAPSLAAPSLAGADAPKPGSAWPITYVDGLANPKAIAFSPDGATAYVADAGGGAGIRADEIQVVDVASRRIVRTFQNPYAAGLVNHGAEPAGISLNPGGTRVYVGESDGTIATFDAASGREMATMAVAAPYARAFTSTGNQGIVLASNGSLAIVDLTTGATVQSVGVGPLYSVDAYLTVSPNGRTVYVTQPHSSVSYVDAVDLTSYAHTRIPTTLTSVNGLVVAPDGNTLYVSGGTSSIAQIDVATQAVIRHDNVAGGTNLTISKDGHALFLGQHATATTRIALNRVDTALWTVTPVTVPASPQTGAYDVNLEAGSGRPALSPDGAHLLVAVEGYGLAAFDVSTSPAFAGWVPTIGHLTGIAVPAVGHAAYVSSTPDNSLGGFPSEGVGVLDTKTDIVTATIPVLYGASSVGVSPDGTKLVATDYAGANLQVIDPASRAVVKVLPVPGGAKQVIFGPDGSKAYLVSTSSVLVVDTSGAAAGDSIIGSFALPVAGSHIVVLSPDGKRMYVIDDVHQDALYAVATATGKVSSVNLKLGTHDWTAGLAVSLDSKTVYVSIPTFGAGGSNEGRVQAVSAGTLKRGKSVAFYQGGPRTLLAARDGTRQGRLYVS